MRFQCDRCGRVYVADENLKRPFRMKCRQCGNFIVVTESSPEVPPPSGARNDDPFAAMAAELSRELASVPEGPPLAPPDPLLATGVPGGTTRRAGAAVPYESDQAFADLGRQMEEETGAKPLEPDGESVATGALSAPAEIEAVQVDPTPASPAPGPRPGSLRASRLGVAIGAAAAAVVAVLVLTRRGAGETRPAFAPTAAPAPAAAASAAPTSPPLPGTAARAAPVSVPGAAERAPSTSAPVAAGGTAPGGPSQARAGQPGPAPVRAARQSRQPKERPAEKARVAEPPRKVAEARPKPAPRPAPAAPARSASPPPRPAAPPSDPAPAESRAAPSPLASPGAFPSAGASGGGSLDDAAIASTIAGHRRDFDGCVQAARRDEPQLVGEARRVVVTITVSPGGRALYPTLDDVGLNGTALGACLKREAGRMAFPPFGGEAVRVRVPLPLK